MENREANLSAAGTRQSWLPAAAFIAAACLVPLAYTFYTGHIWEDFFITFRHSRNLTEGHGLLYNQGERIHGFTSPLGVLLPALCHLLTGSRSHIHALWLFRLLFCLPAFVGAGWFMVKMARAERPEWRAMPVCVALLYLLEVKTVAFAMNGMESAFMCLFLAWSLFLLQDGLENNWRSLGVAWAGMMWTRPDSCVYILFMAVAHLAFTELPRRRFVGLVLRAAAVTTALYLPWLLWTWWYYGTPIPHTIVAKNALLARHGRWASVSMLFDKLPTSLTWAYAPIYPQFRSWPWAVDAFCAVTGWIAFLYWLVPGVRDRFGKAISLMYFLLSFYIAWMIFPFPWYFPPMALLASLILCRAAFCLSARFLNRPGFARAPVCLLAPAVVMLAMVFGLVAFQMRLQQRIIEDGVRIPLGRWLKENSRPGDRIYLEALGYIGYFSGGHMLDYTGLVTPRVAELVGRRKLTFPGIVPELKPEWVVFRLHELPRFLPHAYFRENYELAAAFDRRDELGRHPYIPGEGYLLYDACFRVFRHRAPNPPPAAPPTAPGKD